MKASNVLYLIVGAGIGFFAGVYTSKEKYKKIADDEIKSVIEEFRRDGKTTESKNETSTIPDKAEAIRKNYNKAFESEVSDKKEEYPMVEMIDEDEFGDAEDDNGVPYVTETLFYYNDGVLANGDNDVASDAVIGRAHISPSDWVNDAVYFRNHKLKLDIEILKEDRCFKDVKEKEQYYEEE